MTESLAFYVELSRMATNPVVSSPILQPINTLPTNTNPYPHNPTPTPHPISAGAVDWLGLVQLIGSTYPYVPICTPLIQESWKIPYDRYRGVYKLVSHGVTDTLAIQRKKDCVTSDTRHFRL